MINHVTNTSEISDIEEVSMYQIRVSDTSKKILGVLALAMNGRRGECTGEGYMRKFGPQLKFLDSPIGYLFLLSW